MSTTASFRWGWFAATVGALAMASWAILPGRTEAPATGGGEPTWVHVKLTSPAAASILGAHHTAPLFDAAIATDTVLERWHRIEVASAREGAALAARLAADPAVTTAFVAPHVEPAVIRTRRADAAGGSCPIATPSYAPYQGYLGPAPAGIDAPAAWGRAGGRGAGVSFADIEGAWNLRHEDIPTERMEHVGGRTIRDRHWEAHGTAVVGVVAARDNDLGMIGIAPDVDRVLVSSIGRIGPAAAIARAQAALAPGDVLLIELHGIGPRNRFIPMEYWDDVYDAIRLATDRGVIVIEAAGNGGEDLDHRTYRGVFDRAQRDSGAIMVGAGAPARPGYADRSRLWFSNYGARVDVQGWGYKVATFDYGDLQDCSASGRKHDRTYTDEFAGTSSASPVVAGAAVALQGIYKAAHGGDVLPPRDMRDLLRRTGTPQTDGPEGPAAAQPIGPRPDLARAVESL